MHSTLIVSLIVISTGFAVASGGSAETLNNNSHQRLVAPEGTLLTVYCDAPLPSAQDVPHVHHVTWLKDGRALGSVPYDTANFVLWPRAAPAITQRLLDEVQAIPHIGLLVLPQVSRADAGVYACEVRDRHERALSISAPSSVVVAYIDAAQPTHAIVHAARGSLVQLHCPSPAAYPPVNVIWRKEDELVRINVHTSVQVDSHRGHLTLAEVADADAANYSCTARNLAGSRLIAVIELVVSANSVRGNGLLPSSIYESRPVRRRVSNDWTHSSLAALSAALWLLLLLAFVLFLLMLVYMGVKTRACRRLLPPQLSRTVHPGRVRVSDDRGGRPAAAPDETKALV